MRDRILAYFGYLSSLKMKHKQEVFVTPQLEYFASELWGKKECVNMEERLGCTNNCLA